MHNLFSDAITRALRLQRQPVVQPGPDGLFVFGLPRAYRVATGAIALGLTGILVASWLALPPDPVRRLFVVVIFGPLAFFSVWAVWDAYFVRLTATSSSIRRSGPFGAREAQWLKVTSVTYEPLLSLFAIRTLDTCIRFTAYRHGLSSLSTLAWHGLTEDVRGMSSVIGLEAERNTAA